MASECRSRRLTGEASASGEITDWRESDCAHASESDMQEDPIGPMKRHAGQPVSGKSTWTYREAWIERALQLYNSRRCASDGPAVNAASRSLAAGGGL